jgi:hypothetical protein
MIAKSITFDYLMSAQYQHVVHIADLKMIMIREMSSVYQGVVADSQATAMFIPIDQTSIVLGIPKGATHKNREVTFIPS